LDHYFFELIVLLQESYELLEHEGFQDGFRTNDEVNVEDAIRKKRIMRMRKIKGKNQYTYASNLVFRLILVCPSTILIHF